MEHRSQSLETDNSQGTYNAGIVQTSLPPSNESEAENDHFCQQLCDTPEDFTVKPTSNKGSGATAKVQIKTPRTEEEAWAVGSLVILLTILLGAVYYTKLWRKGNHGESFERSRVWNDESEPGSVSVAAIVRKFPHMLRNKMDKVRSARVSQKKRYQRVREDDYSYSEDKLL